MTLEQKVNEGIKQAMLSRNAADLRGMRAIKAAILLAKTSEGSSAEPDEASDIKMLQKLVKQRKDALEIYRTQHREDLAKKEEEELEVIGRFLPSPMSETELKKAVSQIIAEAGASSTADMGKVMGIAVKKLSGEADSKAISAAVRELLTK